MPLIVTVFEITSVFGSTPNTSPNANGFGVVSGPTVVDVNVSETPPTVSVVSVFVAGIADAVWRTQTVWPFAIVPAVETNTPVQPIEYVPPVTLIGAGSLMPLIVTVFDVCTEPSGTSVTSVNTNASGMTSCASVVDVNVSDTPPTVSVESTAVENAADEVWRTHTVSPLTTVPAAL